MKFLKSLLWVIVGAPVLFSAGAAAALERPEIHFDDQTWVVGNQATAGDILAVEFIPEGQTIDNWSEMVTSQLFSGFIKPGGVALLLDKTKNNLSQKCPAIRWKVVRQSESDAVYEWGVDACKGVDDQSEIARIIQGNEGIHVLHYAIKKSPIPSEKRVEWTRRLEETRLLS